MPNLALAIPRSLERVVNNGVRHVQLLIWVILILLALTSLATAAEAQQSATQIKQRLEAVQEQIRGKRTTFATVQGQVGDLEA